MGSERLNSVYSTDPLHSPIHRMHRPLHRPLLTLFIFSLAAIGSVHDVRAQDQDSTMIRVMDPLIVTAERAESPLSLTTSSVSVLEARELRQRPARSLTDLLGTMPGLLFLDVNGIGWSPQAVTRGFYGGGEAEYVVVLKNGMPVNNLENGLVNWEQLVREPDARVEVLRGGASSLYGDAAIGAVINIVTDANAPPHSHLELGAGSFGAQSTRVFIEDDTWSAAADYGTTDGYRDHGKRTTASLSAQRNVQWGTKGGLTLSGSLNSRDAETPGPIRSTEEGDRAQSLSFFQFDEIDEQTRRAAAQGWLALGPGRFRATLAWENRDQRVIRTLPLAAVFADTQERVVDADGWRTSLQYTEWQLPIGLAHSFTIGVDGYIGTLGSKYHQIATGDETVYQASAGGRQALNADGTASRSALAGYVHMEIRPVERVKMAMGARYDRIADSFDAVEGLSEEAQDATNTAFSPKIGVNVRYASTARHVGNAWVNASRSFKAPTLDQLYDLRALPVPFPPFEVRIASPLLTPQEGTAFEAGLYHLLAIGDDWQGRLSVSGYTMDMENEIDFSFETFSNVNIGKSRHRGIESGLTVGKTGFASVFANYTLQDVTQQSGDNAGNAVKAIPKHAISAGVTAEAGAFAATLVLKSLKGMWVDDANTVELPDYSTVDIRLSWDFRDWRLTADMFNAFDRDYDTTAYPDPAGSEVLFLFPSAPRALSFGAQYTF